MTVTTVGVICDVSMPDDSEYTAATLEFTLSGPDYDTASNDAIVPDTVRVTLDADGLGTAALWPVDRGTRNTHYRVDVVGSRVVNGATTAVRFTLGAIRPPAAGAPHDLADLLAQSSGGILVGSTVYATIADAVAAALAAAAQAELIAGAVLDASLLPLEHASRAALVSAVGSGLAIVSGFTYRAGGLSFIGSTGATAIADLPGLVALGPWRMAHLGGVGDGATNQSAVWAALCAAVKAAGGGEIYIDEGTYLFSTGQSLFTMDCDVKAEWHPKALFKGASGITTGLIRWSGASGTDRGNYKWEFVNPRIDQSLGALTGNQPSGIYVQNVREVKGHGGYFYGGAPWSGTPTTGGDSGVESVNVGDFAWNNGWFEGWRDAAFYPGGGNDAGIADDGVRALVQGAYITGCVQGITFKRDGFLVAAIGNYIELCDIGITTSDVGLGQEVKTGQQMQVYNNTIRKSVARAIGVRGQTLATIVGNVIEDWGYTRDGVTLGPAAPSLGRQAILCQGGRNSVISDNTFRMREWTENNHVGILVTEYTDVEGTVWEAGSLSGGDNRFNVTIPIYEISTANVYPSRLVNNRDTATLAIAAMRNGTIYETTQPGNDALVSWRGNASNIGVRSLILREQFVAFQTGTLLSGLGSLASATTSANQYISVPGAVNGDAVTLTPNSAAGINSRLNYAFRALTDQVEVQVRNDHTSAVDFTSQSFTLTVSRRS